jgi:heptose I phosphotransferase
VREWLATVSEYFLRADLQRGALSAEGDAETLLQWALRAAGQAPPEAVYRDREGRKTLRLELDGRGFFLKLHRGVGWAEIFKNLLQGRLPIVGAGSEFRALCALEAIGVESLAPAAFASFGLNPARLQSMILTDELTGTVSLEDYCADWSLHPPPSALRLQLVVLLADIARRMHGAGINHRDFYLCHFHLVRDSLAGGPLRCHLIDLHRAQLRRQIPRRWRVKDLAGLYFSAMDCGLSQRDLQRFARHYCPGGLRQAMTEQAGLWRSVSSAAERLYLKAHGTPPPPLTPAGARHRGR